MLREQKTNKMGCPCQGMLEAESTKGARSVATLEFAKESRVNLLEEILDRNNLNAAYAQVVRKKGTGGVDGMQVGDLKQWRKENKEEFLASLRTGRYIPQPVKRVEIPKPDGGTRKLGIPTALDRLIQQAIEQVLTPIFEKKISVRSYGFRPGRNTRRKWTST